MSQDIAFIKKTLQNHEEVDSPYDLIIGDHVKYITLKGDDEYFYMGGEYKGMGDNIIFLKDKGKRIKVPLVYVDKEGHILYKTRLYTESECEFSEKEKQEYESIIQTQQRIIETMTEKITKHSQIIMRLQEENLKYQQYLSK
tara:strand:- start:145 stop:570 length:426 start_codon:yes stop_codon:yes gene_type:complete